MNTIKATATANQIAGWLETTLAGAKRQMTMAKAPAIQQAYQIEYDAINRAIRELKDGGLQTDLEEATKKK